MLSHHRFGVVFSFTVLSLASSFAAAQFAEPDAVSIFEASTNSGSFGWAVSELGDVDGDGLMDAIIGQPFGSQGKGSTRIHSSATGARLFLSIGNNPGDQLGYAIADAGDVNLDGIPDIIAGAPSGGYCRVISGDPAATPRTLFEFSSPNGTAQFGAAVSSVGDVNGDGRSDLLVGSPNETVSGAAFAGLAYICSGLDGSVIHTLTGPTGVNASFGPGVAGVGDLDGDGVCDAVVAATGAKRAYAFSGATGAKILPTIIPAVASGTFGQFFVGKCGDLTGDGVPDIYIGDYSMGRAHVYSGADMSEHLLITGASGIGPGRGLNADADGDGVPDLTVGAYTSSAGAAQGGQIRVISGADGSLIRTITSTVSGSQLGFDAVGLGDINGDGHPDILGSAAAGNTVYFIAGTPPPCTVDLNRDGIVDNGDIGAFIALFLADDLVADLNGDGLTDNGDIGEFVSLFLLGC